MARIICDEHSASGSTPASSQSSRRPRRDQIPRTPAGQVLEGNASRVPLPDASADAVWLSLVIHHTPDLEVAAHEIRRVLRPGAPILIRQGVRRTRPVSRTSFSRSTRFATPTRRCAVSLRTSPPREGTPAAHNRDRHGSARSRRGSSATPSRRISKCRWGPVAFPVAPTVPMTSPGVTMSPVTIVTVSRCP